MKTIFGLLLLVTSTQADDSTAAATTAAATTAAATTAATTTASPTGPTTPYVPPPTIPWDTTASTTTASTATTSSTTVNGDHCQPNRYCALDKPPNNLVDGVDYVFMSTTSSCNECRVACLAKAGCTGYTCGTDESGCSAWMNGACSKTEFAERNPRHPPYYTCKMDGKMETDKNLCPLYVHPESCMDKEIKDCNWKGCVETARSIQLSYMGLTGDISEITVLKNIEYLQLINNKITGSVEKLATLTKLKTLQIDYNQLTGKVKSLEALTSLTFIDLSDNKVSGPIPTAWCDGKITCDLRNNPDACVPGACQNDHSCGLDHFCKSDIAVVHGRNLREEN